MNDRRTNPTGDQPTPPPCPPWCQRTYVVGQILRTHVAQIGSVRHGVDAETVVHIAQIDARTRSEEWVREAPDISITDYTFGPLTQHDVDDLTIDQARGLARLFDNVGRPELAGLLRRAADIAETKEETL